MEEKKIKQEKIRKVFLEGLPRKGKFINWLECIGNKIHFIYNEIENDLQIIGYNSNTTTLIIKYDEINFEIRTGHLQKCQLGSILKKKTSDFKIEIGTRFQDDKRDITIIDRKYIKDKRGQTFKKYKYHCNICGFDCDKHWSTKDKKYKEELWIVESSLERGSGCSCCCSSPQIVVKDINSIYSNINNIWMIKFLKNIKDIYNHNVTSSDKVQVICPNCKGEKEIQISTLYTRHSIGCRCDDNQPYPEKFMHNVLTQLCLNFQTQLTKTNFSWCKNYRYDFYFELNGEQYIVETHGSQHYKESGQGRTLKEEQENDKLKKKLALTNGIKSENYIIIDCRKSELKWIKQNLLNSKLNELFNLNIIDWLNAEEFACCNLVKIICDYKMKYNCSVSELSDIFKYDKTTIRNWLKSGVDLKWYDYCAKDENAKSGKINSKLNCKPIEILKNGISLGCFESATELERQSEKLFGVKLGHSAIARVCNGKKMQYKEFTFKYI